MQIDTILKNDGKTFGVEPVRVRWFGGSKSSIRRQRCLAYAWRQHRKTDNPAPFWFRVTGSVFRDRRIGTDKDGKGKARPTVGGGRVIGFVTAADRKRSYPFLRALGYNHFTEFRDVNATFALMIGTDHKTSTDPQPLKPGVLFSNRVR